MKRKGWVVCNLGWASWGVIGIGMISTEREEREREMEMMGGTKGGKKGPKRFPSFFFCLLLLPQPPLGSSSTRPPSLLY